MELEELQQLLSYDPKTGFFTWRRTRSRFAYRGQIAGRLTTKGYRHIAICGEEYYAHRLAWLFSYREWPDGWLDHINRDRDDNRIRNLRLATHVESNQNTRAKSNSRTGLKGVTQNGNRWMARIRHGGRRIQIGSFATKEEAAEAYRNAALTLHREFAPIE